MGREVDGEDSGVGEHDGARVPGERDDLDIGARQSFAELQDECTVDENRRIDVDPASPGGELHVYPVSFLGEEGIGGRERPGGNRHPFGLDGCTAARTIACSGVDEAAGEPNV